MEPTKGPQRTFIPGIVTDPDSSWRRCYRKMKLGKTPLLSPKTTPAPGNGVTAGGYSPHSSSPSDSLTKRDQLAPLEQGDYFSFDPVSGKLKTKSSASSAESVDLTKRPILSPTSNCMRHTSCDSEKLNFRPQSTSSKSIQCFKKYPRATGRIERRPSPRLRYRILHENDGVFLTKWNRAQVDGMDEVGRWIPRTRSPSPGQPARRERAGSSGSILEMDADGDIILPDADAPRRSGRPQRRWRTSPRSSMSIDIDLKSPANACFPGPDEYDNDMSTPLVPACPAIEPIPLPVRYQEKGALNPLSLSRWAPENESSRRAQVNSKQLDRFILPRKSPTSSRESLRLSTQPASLSDFEKATRQRHPAFDPFSRRVPRSTRVQDAFQDLQRQTSANRSRSSPLDWNNSLALRHGPRQVSDGAVWNVGGSGVVSDSVSGIPDGRGGMLTSGTNAPLHTSMFLTEGDAVSEQEAHEKRLAFAMGIDQSSRILGSFEDRTGSSPTTPSRPCWTVSNQKSPEWVDGEWIKRGSLASVLDAPHLRDDFYCSTLAYSHTAKCLAVGLGSNVYLWSETQGVGTPESINGPYNSYVTSLSFSSAEGGQSVLAIGRHDGSVALWSVFDEEPRFNAQQPHPISCVSFATNITRRSSMRDPAIFVDTEQLLIGDEVGNVYFFSVEWPDSTTRDLFDWPGEMTLLARLSVHTQQICGLAWSPQGEFFATGGNDNDCFLFETKQVLSVIPAHRAMGSRRSASGSHHYTVRPGNGPVPSLDSNVAKHKWALNAAVKAMAFCPWQRGLLAIGGGSNDRCIHFYHTFSGACLATVDCSAQVTSLIWSTTRREICATFGFAQPEHHFRIAIFSWPACEQLVAIPWADEHRALYAISYPGGPNDGRTKGEGGRWWSRTQVEGCIVVATSDSSIKFHEVWSEERRRPKRVVGGLGGSEILGELHGMERDEDMVIR
ncbi:putative WD repeat-containing protein [Diplodia seriata]|uniref:Putative WD repeat-containing protein n=1 Tax=Diplodia seriata TaxID=420778 RepID=A0A1S8BBM0_9PEZI|nr:putative WD repeat-containing protein [Diplodia seriata]